jgi:23S rRNA pseudouridine2605 synthase
VAERVQKVLARLGYGSRRQIEEWMRAGRVRVNGVPARPGDTLSPTDVVTLDGRRLKIVRAAPICRVLMYNKPEGEICSRSDPQGRPSIFDHLPSLPHGRWISIGRLDVNTTGLILVTTDGDLANRLMHPSAEIEREYVVRVRGEVGPDTLDRLRRGIVLEDGPAAFSAIRELGGRGMNRWYGVTLKEGRKREVRRLWEAVGLQVSRLKRVRFGPVALPSHLRRGEFMELDARAIAGLKAAAALT